MLVSGLVGCINVTIPPSENGGDSAGNQNGGSDNSGGGSTNTNYITSSQLMSNELIAYDVHPECKENLPVDSFTDGYYNYFIFKIGEVDKVPIYSDNKQRYNGIGELNLVFSTTTTISTSIERSHTACLQNTVSMTSKTTGELQDINEIAKIGFELSSSITSMSSTSKTVTTSVTETVAKYTATSYTLSPSCPAGYYRFTIYGNCDVYAFVAADLENKVFDISYHSLVKPESIEEGWYYSESGAFKSDRSVTSAINKLTLADSVIDSLDMFAELNTVKHLNRVNYTLPELSGMSDENAKIITLATAEKLDYQRLKDLGYKNVRVSFTYSVKTPSGTCKAVTDMYISSGQTDNYEVWSKSVEATTSMKNLSGSFELTLDEFSVDNYKLILVYYAKKNGALDFAKNKYTLYDLDVKFEVY